MLIVAGNANELGCLNEEIKFHLPSVVDRNRPGTYKFPQGGLLEVRLASSNFEGYDTLATMLTNCRGLNYRVWESVLEKINRTLIGNQE